jgi:hypothetical protein
VAPMRSRIRKGTRKQVSFFNERKRQERKGNLFNYSLLGASRDARFAVLLPRFRVPRMKR